MANPSKLKQVSEFRPRGILFCIAQSARDDCVYVGSSDFGVYEVDLSQKKIEPKLVGKHESYVTGIALAGKMLVSGSYNQRLIWWDVEKRAQARKVEAHQKWIRNVVASPDGKVIASVADDMVCRVWDAESGKKIHELRGHKEDTPNNYKSMLYAVTISSDSKYLARGDKVGHVVIWDLKTGKQLKTVESPGMYTWDPRQRRHSIGGIRSLAFSADNKMLAVGGIGKIGNIDHLGGPSRTEVFDWQTGKTLALFENGSHKGLIQHLEFDPNGEWLLGAGGANNGFYLFYNVKSKKTVLSEKVPMHVHDLMMRPEQQQVVMVGHQRGVIYEMK